MLLEWKIISLQLNIDLRRTNYLQQLRCHRDPTAVQVLSSLVCKQLDVLCKCQDVKFYMYRVLKKLRGCIKSSPENVHCILKCILDWSCRRH